MAFILIFVPKYSNDYLVSANDYNATTTKKKYATLMGKEKFNPFYCNEHVIKTDITIWWSYISGTPFTSPEPGKIQL